MRTPLTPGRRAALAIGIPLILVSAIRNGVDLASISGRATVTTTTSYDVHGTHFTIASIDGNVTITQSPDAQVHLTSRVRYGIAAPHVTVRADDTGLRIDSQCSWYLDGCSVDLDVSVPTEMSLDVEASGGDVHAAGLSSEARLVSSGGDVTAMDMSGTLTIRSSGGDVRGERLASGQVTANSSGGDVDVRFARAPHAVDAHSSGGSVTVHVPSGLSYRIDASSSGGDVHVTVPKDDLSERVLTADSSGGDVTIVPDGVAR